ncbi:hypothetical protein ACFOLF_04550 [Paenibacillus sepulcri]|uniref:Uncharacterized protein n=1 Tax=Paenibacillus sepulcri TaxID=359917 RepID=A0ABS7C1F2_9BACL|nr:hypothetical protein [Paenibacillus sepulcri]
MTYRSIDLQVSIPRTQEKGNLQNQLNQKPVIDQTRLEGDSVKQTEQLRSKNSEIEQSVKMSIKDQPQQGNHSKRKRRGNAGDGSIQEEAGHSEQAAHNHPYKGKHIDISL